MSNSLPQVQHAIQLVGRGKLRLNTAKPVSLPSARQVLARVEAVGLCFSDLKLLKQFSSHPRKSEIVQGLAPEALLEIPSYAPGEMPTVPGHEVVCRIVAVGPEVLHHRTGERCLVQTDYRTLRTATSNAAFGYNFEGGLQEYVLMDERVIIDPDTGERFLIPVGESLSASSVALVEPWACVEGSYSNAERRALKPDGRLLVVAPGSPPADGLNGLFESAKPQTLITVKRAEEIAALPDESFDDIICFDTDRRIIEALNDKVAAGGIVNLVTMGRRIGEPVSIGIGRIHYGSTRWIGTTSAHAARSYDNIPSTGEIRPGDRILILGAAGPMGQMHVIRNICQGVRGISITCADLDDSRLEVLEGKACRLSETCGVPLEFVNTSTEALCGKFSYQVILAPVGAAVADAIRNSLGACIINIFAGIPASTRQELDLDTYIASRCYMFGTSGSVIRDMKVVLDKMQQGRLDTDCSVDAVSGMAGAEEGLAAIENRTLAGKVIAYPALHSLGLIPLKEMSRHFPTVAEKLSYGQWTKPAEEELLRCSHK